jgi:hypothetical protein
MIIQSSNVNGYFYFLKGNIPSPKTYTLIKIPQNCCSIIFTLEKSNDEDISCNSMIL